ncbi:actin [Pelomyxa schiedti]|nr:actin [Pelomyxa schiedti]
MATRAVVMDCGSGWTKVGFSGDATPRATFPSTVVGCVPSTTSTTTTTTPTQVTPGVLAHPIDRGLVTDWDSMRLLCLRAYSLCSAVTPPSQSSPSPSPSPPQPSVPVLLTEPPLSPRPTRERMAWIAFETLPSTPCMCLACDAVMSLYATGRTSGIVVETGDGVTHTVPICDGSPLNHAVLRLELAGRDLTDYMVRMLAEERGYSLSNTCPTTIDDVKEKLGYVPLGYEAEMEAYSPSSSFAVLESVYELPDGEVICIGTERFRCPEPLFQPSLLHGTSSLVGIHEMCYNSITKCDPNIHSNLCGSIVLSGGSSMFRGLPDRMQMEMTTLVSSHQSSAEPMRVRITAPQQRKCLAWVGGSILASLSTFQQMCITKEQFDESGPSVIHKCP